MKAIIKRFLKEETGVTAIEYGLIAGLIAVAIVAGVSSIGGSLGNMFTNLGKCITSPSTDGTANSACTAPWVKGS
ncbi:Flp/Fap pilin component [Burkholderia multivorans]|jgi:pilus assembly protein Flp/PilA|uniref:Flp family type IVb pilin n=1 Tax=Burkholderia multivorans TaxID=87883 RepID=UPI0006A578A5|nr:Flp family type IVb pilin [Burkholderia multivorans]KOE26232.1 pilus assembly protein [Burkholderia multivorans R-20526]MBH9660902.1 Flp family type IVb pilin [Burkholderia multivorans]MBU9209106.1 Flp family type IVb pilin [Burkholderia multivorans]MBU9247109.1 Flp family type IVb pilin [Burkholderia multivorans]MBU9339453.1 Flp family type IVb pilin [Burkholderia multivorans]